MLFWLTKIDDDYISWAVLQSNFAPVDEIDEAIEIHQIQIEGAIPEDFPEGVYIRNGDSLFSLFL